MSARYTREALSDLDQISSHLAKRSPSTAAALLDAVESAVARLDRFPMSAQLTEIPRIRSAPVSRYPYIVFYSAEPHGITVHYVRHAARLRPWEAEE